MLVCACAGPDQDGDGYSDDVDCLDTDPSVHPGATDVCDRIDNDCDGIVDNSADVVGYADVDRDGSHGTPTHDVCATVSDAPEDCDDNDPAAHPGAEEVCGDGIDNDCDGEIETEGCRIISYTAPDSESLGRELYVSPNPQWWIYEQRDPEVGLLSNLGSASTEDGVAFDIPILPSTDFITGSISLEATDGAWFLGGCAYGASSGSAVYQFLDGPEGEGTRISYVSEKGGEDLCYDTSLLTTSDSAYLLSSFQSSVFIFDEYPEGEVDADSTARLQVTNDQGYPYFGRDALLLPDDGGDALPEVLLAVSDSDKDSYSAIHIFDGASSGVYNVGEADVVLSSELMSLGTGLTTVGDLNNDGYEDIAFYAFLTDMYVFYGPLQTSRTLESRDLSVSGDWLAGVHSFNGDILPDLCVRSDPDDGIYIIAGPVEPGTYDVSDAAEFVSYPDTSAVRPLLADPDYDGDIELIIGDEAYDSFRGQLQFVELAQHETE